MIKSIAILSLLILLSSIWLPWWIIVVVSFVYMGYATPRSLGKAIAISFLSGFTIYLLYSVMASINLERQPSELIANLFGALPFWSSYIISAIIGGLAAAFGGMSGYLGGRLIQK